MLFTTGGLGAGLVLGAISIGYTACCVFGHRCCKAGLLFISGALVGGPVGAIIGGVLGHALGGWIINNI